MAISRYTLAPQSSIPKGKLPPDWHTAISGMTIDPTQDEAQPAAAMPHAALQSIQPGAKAPAAALPKPAPGIGTGGVTPNPFDSIIHGAPRVTADAPLASTAKTFTPSGPVEDQYKPTFDPADTNMDGIISLAEQQAQETKVANTNLDIGKAQAQAQAAAKANLGGMGLSGAAAVQQSDIGAAQDRNKVETLATLRGKQNDEAFQAQQRLDAIWSSETADGVDLNGDNVVGPPGSATGKTPDQAKAEQLDDKRKQLESDLTTGNKGYDLWWMDADTAPGTIEKPYTIPQSRRAEMDSLGFGLTPVPTSGIPRDKNEPDHETLYRDIDGNYYLFR